MPLYDFVCPDCGHKEEIYKSISDRNSVEECENCGEELDRVPTACAFHLKGSGWYTTDYKNNAGTTNKGKQK